MSEIKTPEHGFSFGFELETLYRRYGATASYGEAADRIIKSVNDKQNAVLWGWCVDGKGPEFKTRTPFYDVEAFLSSVKLLVGELRANGRFDVSERVHDKKIPEYVSPYERSASPRGIHFHVSHPRWRLTSTPILTNKEKMRILSMVPQTEIKSRMHYCKPAFLDSKYAAIHIVEDDHLEIRSFNATLNIRGICKMLQTTIDVANAVHSNFEGGKKMHT